MATECISPSTSPSKRLERLFATIWRRRFELVEIDSGNGIERWAARDGGFYPPTLTPNR